MSASVGCRLGVSVREYRRLETRERSPTFETWEGVCKLYGWPQTFVADRTERASRYGSQRPSEGQCRHDPR
jgi:hypothetical protein